MKFIFADSDGINGSKRQDKNLKKHSTTPITIWDLVNKLNYLPAQSLIFYLPWFLCMSINKDFLIIKHP